MTTRTVETSEDREATNVAPGELASSTEWRAFYEQQGRRAQDAGQTPSCSIEPVVAAVRRMTGDPRWKYRSVLDVGCGANASYSTSLETSGKTVVGLDFAFAFLSIARQHGRIRLIQGDATALPFPDESFDAVVCSETLEHIPNDELAIAEVRRVLMPGGLLFLTVPNYWNASRVVARLRRDPRSHDLQVGHLREYNRQQIDVMLGPGFRVLARYWIAPSWRGVIGGPLDFLIRTGVLSRLSISIALVAERATDRL